MIGERRSVFQARRIDLGFAGFGNQRVGQSAAAHRPYRKRVDRVDQALGRRSLGLDDRGNHGYLALGNQPEHLRVKVRLRIEVAVHAARSHARPCGDQGDLGILPSAQRHGIPGGIQNARFGFNELIEPDRCDCHNEP